MMSQNPLAIVDLMIRHQVPIVLIGGHAVNHHGFARATEDVDLVYRRGPGTDPRLLRALNEANAFYIADEIDPATGIERTFPVDDSFVTSKHLMMVGTDYGYLDVFDFLPGLPGEPLDGLFETAIDAGGRPVASLAWLRRMKSASGRPQDLRDLENLPEA